MIFQKTSQYNRGGGKLDGYDAKHNSMTSNEFRQWIDKYRTAYNARQAELEAEALSAKEPPEK